jgi:hypothetical protein
MFFTDKNRKKNLIVTFTTLPFFCGLIFVVGTSSVSASYLGDAVEAGFKLLLYGVFVFFGYLTSVAVTLFGWAINPDYISGNAGLLNGGSIYRMWQFIRDFFNLFFILVLLYIAFTVVFQINKDFKKAILSLVLAALFVNFSFPVSRFLIDATNVPMYFFANQMLSDPSKPGESFGTALKASQLQGILVPGSQGARFEFLGTTTVSQLLTGVVFLFLFSITLLVLAILFIIRLMVLVILVIFSSVGFVASIIPGMGQYSKMWWDNFWKYALFGPAAMLMLLIATRFFAEISQDQTFSTVKTVATQASTANDLGLIASMAMFSIPIIMLWMAMGLAQKMSIVGASSVVGLGQKVSKWVGKQATLTPVAFLGRKYEKLMTTRSGKVGAVTKWLAPTAVYKGWEKWREHSHEKDRSPVEQAGAGIADELGAYWPITPFREHTDHAFKNYSAQIAKEQKEISSISTNSDFVIHELIDAIKAGDDEKTIGAIQILGAQNDFNDMMHAMSRIQHETGKQFGKDGKSLASNDMSSENAKEAIKQMMLQTGTSPELAAKAMLNISNTAIAAGNVGMAGAARFNGKEFVISSEEDQANVAAFKLQNLETQARQRTLHHNAIFKEEGEDKLETIVVGKDESGKDIEMKVSVGDINGKVGQAVLGTITKSDKSESKRSRDDLKREISNRMLVLKYGTAEQKAKLSGMKKIMDENENVNEYFKEMFEHYTGNKYDGGATSPEKKDKKDTPPASS